ncbi:unnamed protein product [Zymoseptoria tritici ST99CH_1A5]|uniref:Protein sip5 n=2 Tax=Zymoseptoria tritici TaxID=1047171 RepID=A0A2H1G3Q2_ZYMTR|nr:unnamed protein product [Zymoseptoria tritici ST99CH_1E4]SMY22099.1 unnamed protein product [Zymoseptoria tritici ST99CH_1A5]
MGNSSSKDEKRANGTRHGNNPSRATQVSSSTQATASSDALSQQLQAPRASSRRGSRHDLSIFNIGRGGGGGERIIEITPERPRETKQEREARKVEKERQARVKERERSMREEHVDGGYLVTVGTYTGPEDFNKAVVRQLMIERRLAPFWKGLEDHNEAWTEAQLFAAARGLPIPAPDEVPAEMARTTSQATEMARTTSQASSTVPPGTDANVNSLTVPITSRSQSYQSDHSANLSASHPAFSNTLSSPSSPSSAPTSTFRGRAKTLASLASGNKSQSPDLTPQEVRLPTDPYVNGQQLEVYLYKDAAECPICFLYYPPYLNRTRCCDQAICSECFVQIKRPDPHPPEHEQPGQPRAPEEEADLLVSEVAACPFCVTPEFGVTYEPPPFRRGLAYAGSNSLRNAATSAMSSSTSLHSGSPAVTRRRATSISATSSNVITTDRVRPDWAKKLADARANALRRSAAATALHNAAYVLGNVGEGGRGNGLIGRRRRGIFTDSPGGQSGSVTPREGDTTPDLTGTRTSSRRMGPPQRVEDLEEMMMMEAIRQSLAAEEERKKKEEKEVAKEEKRKRKEGKKMEKEKRKRGGSGASGSGSATGVADGKGKGPRLEIPEGERSMAREGGGGGSGASSLSSTTTSSLLESSPPRTMTATAAGPAGQSVEDPQRHLESSRAGLTMPNATPLTNQNPPMTIPQHSRQLSSLSYMSNVGSTNSTGAGEEGGGGGGGVEALRNGVVQPPLPSESGIEGRSGIAGKGKERVEEVERLGGGG